MRLVVWAVIWESNMRRVFRIVRRMKDRRLRLAVRRMLDASANRDFILTHGDTWDPRQVIYQRRFDHAAREVYDILQGE